MAQIKKHQTGGSLGLTEKPVKVTPKQANQLTFTVDGEDFNMSEQDFNAIADRAFNEEVRKGQAKLRDKAKWMQEFNVKLNEAKTGRFGIQSSGDALSNLTYTPSDANYDATSHDGLNADGSAAQRTGIGRLIAPRASGNSDKMAGILNNYIGQGVIASRNKYLADQAATADSEYNKQLENYNSSIKNDAASLANASLGKLAFGADWENPQARKLILDKVWGKEPGHVASIDKAYQTYVSKVFDPYYEGKEDDYLKAGVDIKALRNKLSSTYDPATKQFKAPLNGIGDLYRYADSLDSIASDEPLFNKIAYKNYGVTQSGTGVAGSGGDGTTSTGSTTTAFVPIKEGSFWKNASGRRFLDEKLTQPFTGEQGDLAYSSGYLRTGKYAPTENAADGRTVYNYYSPKAGFYAGGKRVDKSNYLTYLDNLRKDPTKKWEYDEAIKRDRNIDDTYAQENYVNKMTDSFLKDPNITEHGEYAFKNFGPSYKPRGAANVTSMFRGADGQPIKGGIYAVQTDAENHLGLPDAETAIVTDDGYNFRGVMRRDTDGKLKLYKKNADNSLSEIKDNNLRKFLDAIKNVDNLDNSKLSNMLQNRSRFGPAQGSDRSGLELSKLDLRPVSTRLKEALLTSQIEDTPVIGRRQLGGTVEKRNPNTIPASNQIQNHNPTKYESTKGSNLFKEGYKMSTQEKLEAGALVADLAGVGLALTGAGSIAAGVTGVAGTGAQFVADLRRDGADVGDFGNLALGLGLDAASVVPGLGIGAKGAKTLKTIKRASKYLLPALSTIGATKAAYLLGEITLGNKKITDLSVDDFRTLTGGIQGVMGGARTIGQRAAVTRATENTLALKKGKVNLSDDQVKALNRLDGEAQQTQAKLFAIENLNKQGKNVSDVDLKTKRAGFKANTWNRIPGTAQGKTKEVVDITTSDTGFKLKDVDDFKSNSLKDKYMRWAIDKAAIRSPSLGDGESRWGSILGDYYPNNKEVELPNLLGLPKPSGNPMMGIPANRISQRNTRTFSDVTNANNLRRPGTSESNSSEVESKVGVEFNSRNTGVSPSRKGQATKAQNKANKGKQPGDQYVIFKKGGIIKAQAGVKLPKFQIPNYIMNWDKPLGGPLLSKSNPNVADKYINNMGSVLGIPASAPVTLPTYNIPAYDKYAATSKITPGPVQGFSVSPEGNLWSKLKGLAGKVNVNDVSEFARAMATRGVNKRIDTRVEAPLMSAPLEVSVPVTGNLLAKSAFYNRAADMNRRGGIPLTSDGQLATIQNLEANRQADLIRTQGDVEDANAVNNSRMMSLENIQRNNGIRSEVANRNISTLASAKQAERSAENQKIGMVAQPLLTFWENRNAEALRNEAVNKQIDNQISLSTLSNQVGDIKTPLLARATELYSKSLDNNLTPEQRKIYTTQYEAVQKQLEELGSAARINALQLTKNNSYVAPQGYYSKFLKPAFKTGGTVKEMNKLNKEVYKDRVKSIKEDAKNNLKVNLETLKDIQKLIDRALKVK